MSSLADASEPVTGHHSFALCLTHDIDRPYKTFQSPYYALVERDLSHLWSMLPRRNAYWQFEEMMALEEDFGVRSACYFLQEQRLFRDRPPTEWYSPRSWKLFGGRYSIEDPAIAGVIRRLDAGGWEVGLHGSYESYDDIDMLGAEKRRLESMLGHRVVGGRQHYLNLEVPETWRAHVDVGLRYDASLGSRTDPGFAYGYEPHRPFDDEFVVFPLTLMDTHLKAVADDPRSAWNTCESLLEEARDNGAVMTVCWHQRSFSERDFPEHRHLYERLVERALSLDAWVGPPGKLYERLSATA